MEKKNRRRKVSNTKEIHYDESWISYVYWMIMGKEREESCEKLTIGITLRRFFIFLDNLIAPILIAYFGRWILSFWGSDEMSFQVFFNLISNDIFYFSIVFIIAFVIYWRSLALSDSFPFWRNFINKCCWKWLAILLLSDLTILGLMYFLPIRCHDIVISRPFWGLVFQQYFFIVIFLIRRIFCLNIDVRSIVNN